MAENYLIGEAFKHQRVGVFGDVMVFHYQGSSHTNGILYTKGMSAINQHELAGKAEQIHPFIELYFFLPSYWNLEKENQKWPLAVLKRLVEAQAQKKAWFSPGDTLTAHPKGRSNDNADGKVAPINETFKQNYFMLAEPISAETFLKAVEDEDSIITWLAVIPIYQQEFDYKSSRSALELIMDFEKKKVTELVDEHRPISARKKFFGLF